MVLVGEVDENAVHYVWLYEPFGRLLDEQSFVARKYAETDTPPGIYWFILNQSKRHTFSSNFPLLRTSRVRLCLPTSSSRPTERISLQVFVLGEQTRRLSSYRLIESPYPCL